MSEGVVRVVVGGWECLRWQGEEDGRCVEVEEEVEMGFWPGVELTDLWMLS